jgi:predicted MFS family arabinose efflux permease
MLYIGKRPVFLFVSFLSFGGSVWCAEATSWHSLVVARVVSALAYSECESLSGGIEADIFFLHERGVWMGTTSPVTNQLRFPLITLDP